MNAWFSLASKALHCKTIDLQVTLSVDTIYHQLDEYRQLNTAKEFDSIYLSNIPDYQSGHLGTLTYALPSLRRSNSEAFVQSNCQFNTSLFKEGLIDTISEYLCLPTLESARDLVGLDFQKVPDLMEKYGMCDPAKGRYAFALLLFPHRWMQPSLNNFRLPTKVWFTRWITQLFMKTLRPPFRDYTRDAPFGAPMQIEQPSTIYTFLRFCIYLIETRGIPSHWISSFIDQALSGELSSLFDPPAQSPLPPQNCLNPYWAANRTVGSAKVLPRNIQPCLSEDLLGPLPKRASSVSHQCWCTS